MQQNPSPLPHMPELPETPTIAPHTFPVDPTSSSLFDWSDFLDFNLDENFSVSFPDSLEPEQPGFDHNQQQENSGRIRKRDPRLVCSNFLAGRVPCECPELDEQLELQQQEEEFGSALPGKKRVRTARLAGGSQVQCQVPGCEVDISELKGYHKRHRVCLRCANASTVVLDGENKRYCQQCGKFHVLLDFDEGKRSCRRKLERHNNRRRRKPNDSKRSGGKEPQPVCLVDDASGDDDSGKDNVCVSSQTEERPTMVELDGRVSPRGSALTSQHLQNDSVVSFVASGEANLEDEKQNSKYKHSPAYHENRSMFYSVCPSGRISFKLYDWNPAEFPRRLRNQIFQWLASMPVELEGYIRPGCTILTAFIAMPKPMWLKLLEEPSLFIKGLVAPPGNMLFGRGTMLVYLNDKIFRVTKDAASIMKVAVKDRAPKLHYVYPNCFEAGRPMEFVACGSNLLQPRFRFLVSFAGKYLAYDICVSSACCKKGENDNFDHQLVKIYVPQTDVDLFGPAFLEVENESGLSNFIPILMGNKETCTEMEILQLNCNTLITSEEQKLSPSRSPCEVFTSRQSQFSEFVLEVAWLLKKPASEQKLTSHHIQRFNYLLNFLIENDSSVVLGRVFSYIKEVIDDNLIDGDADSDMKLLRKSMDISRNILDQTFQNNRHAVVPTTNQALEKTLKNIPRVQEFSPAQDESAKAPLLNHQVVMNLNLHERPRNSGRMLFTGTLWASRPFIMAVAAFGVCLGVCVVILHPQRVGEIATSIRRCLFDHK
ncbi:squamosa promoter-binding-like protein 7 [Primulina tabacum]|uniref:squamosa promoter-binding-like protein 7 n=1 Tax=Primulina tabacum TaxID=48773 RepID=UPI003F5AC833